MTNQSPLSLTQSQLPVTYQRHNMIQPKKIFPGNEKSISKCLIFLIAIFSINTYWQIFTSIQKLCYSLQ